MEGCAVLNGIVVKDSFFKDGIVGLEGHRKTVAICVANAKERLGHIALFKADGIGLAVAAVVTFSQEDKAFTTDAPTP